MGGERASLCIVSTQYRKNAQQQQAVCFVLDSDERKKEMLGPTQHYHYPIKTRGGGKHSVRSFLEMSTRMQQKKEIQDESKIEREERCR